MKVKDIAKKNGFDTFSFEEYVYSKCKLPLRITGFTRDNLNDADVPAVVEAYREYLQRRVAADEEKKRKEEEQRLAVETIILTTCPQVDGYRVAEQLGLVFGECLFKASLAGQLDAALDDFTSSLSFNDQELTGMTAMLAKAREYARGKMVREAVSRGANAIIGIDAESTTGSSVQHVAIYGTAVKLEPIGVGE